MSPKKIDKNLPQLNNTQIEKIIEKKVAEKLQSLEKRVLSIKGEMFQGPIPPPNLLKQYNEIHPGAAKIIIESFEKQGDHRRHLEKSVIESDIKRANTGTIFSFILGMTALIGGLVLISSGFPAGGIASVISATAGLLASFIYSFKKRKKERDKKRNQD